MDVKLILFFLTLSVGANEIEVKTGNDGSYNVTVGGAVWLRSAPMFVSLNQRKYSTDDGTLVLVNITKTINSTGPVGMWKATNFHYTADNVSIIASVVSYALKLVTFQVVFENGANNTKTLNFDQIICGFPGFKLEEVGVSLGYISFGGEMFGDTNKDIGRWNRSAQLQDGMDGSGPLGLFNGTANALVISPLDNFMASSMWHDKDGGNVYWGIMGGVDQLPAGFKYQTIMIYEDGISDSFNVWGFMLKTYWYKMDPNTSGVTSSSLGYWTSPGSYYHGSSELGKTYEDTLVDVVQYKNKRNQTTPFRYLEYDSWWYTFGQGGGVKEWKAPKTIFPGGEKAVFEKTKLKVAALNTFWSSDTVYAKQNGGNFSFEIEGNIAIPTEEAFWDNLFDEAKQWGLAMYIQSNLSDVFANFGLLRTDLNFGRNWLMNLAYSAKKHNIAIQLEGANPRVAMEAFELPQITQARVSPDYGSKDQWKIGITSLFPRAMSIFPFKDIFLTQKKENGSAFMEANPERQALVATLSRGPIGVGDKYNQVNTPMLLKCCSSSGRILKPDLPAVAIDDQIAQMVFQDIGGPAGEVWTTWSSVYQNGRTNQKHGIIFVSGLTKPYRITPSKAAFLFETGWVLGEFDFVTVLPNLKRKKEHEYERIFYVEYDVLYDRRKEYVPHKDSPAEDAAQIRPLEKSKIFSHKDPRKQAEFSDSNPFTIDVCSADDYCLYYTSPILNFKGKEVLILGELDKWVPMSSDRMLNITIGDVITIMMKGEPGEKVEIWFSIDGKLGALRSQIQQSGTSTLVFEFHTGGGQRHSSSFFCLCVSISLVILINILF